MPRGGMTTRLRRSHAPFPGLTGAGWRHAASPQAGGKTAVRATRPGPRSAHTVMRSPMRRSGQRGELSGRVPGRGSGQRRERRLPRDHRSGGTFTAKVGEASGGDNSAQPGGPAGARPPQAGSCRRPCGSPPAVNGNPSPSSFRVTAHDRRGAQPRASRGGPVRTAIGSPRSRLSDRDSSPDPRWKAGSLTHHNRHRKRR